MVSPNRWIGGLLASVALWGCTNDSTGTSGPGTAEKTAAAAEDLQVNVSPRAVSFEFADLPFLPAGIAAGQNVVFVGSPLDGRVFAYSRYTGRQIGELPQPPGGFVVPFIMHALGDGHVGILGAGGLPQPKPFVPVSPSIYDYSYTATVTGTFSSTLSREIDFGSTLVGFPEDFVLLDDGRILMTDAVLGSIWVIEKNGTISPGIVPKTFETADAIPTLAICPTMPEVTVNGVPFLFSGSTIPGVGPIAARNGFVYFFSACARGLYKFPISILSDHRQPYQRAADFHLVGSTPSNVAVEELLDFQFNPFDQADPYLYAARGMQLEVIRIDSRTGERQLLAHDARLFDFPSSLAFLPPIGGFETGLTTLVVLSNQQERTPITNDAAPTDAFNPPFIVAKMLIAP